MDRENVTAPSCPRATDGGLEADKSQYGEVHRQDVAKAFWEDEECYRDLFNKVNDGVFVIQLDSTGTPQSFIEVNDCACRRLGYSREELLGMPPLSLIPPELLPVELSGMRELVSRKARQYESVLLARDGTRFTFEVTAHVSGMKGPTTIVAICRDVTEKKWAEEALEERNAILESVFSNVHIIGAFLDREFRFVRVNKAFSLFEETPPEFFSGKGYFTLYPDAENERIFKEIIEKREPYFSEEKPFFSTLHPDRGTTYWDWSVHPVQGTRGQLYGVILCLLDRTQRKKAQEALQESERRFHSIFDSSLDAIVLLDDSGNFLDVNPAACSLLDLPKSEILGRHTTEFLEPDLDFEKAWSSLRNVGWRKGDVRIRQSKGTCREIEYAATSSFLPGQHLGILRDITLRKQMQAALEQSEKQLKFLSTRLLTVQEEEKGRLARDLHDNIGQDLAALKFGVENSLRAVGRGDSENAARMLGGLIPMIQRSIQEVRRIFTGLRPTVLDDFGILAAIDWLARETRFICPEISIEKHIVMEEKDVTESSRIAIFRIVQEALSNICHHSKASRVVLDFDKKDGLVVLIIQDNGHGFDLGRMLSGENGEQGFGLLSMRELAELSGGNFRVESSEGGGTTIQVSWPSAEQAA